MIFVDYFYWHYTVASGAILGLLHNYLIGTWHRFLISTHFKTLFSPWHRSQPSDFGKAQSFGDKIMNGVVDFYVRILAAIVRLIIILIGLAAELIIIIAFIALLIIWLLWPVIFIWMVGRGISLIT